MGIREDSEARGFGDKANLQDRPKVLVKLPPVKDIKRIIGALIYGGACHGLFGLGVGAMILSLYTGLIFSFGAVPWPWAALPNLFLLLQFPLLHSFLLGKRGQNVLACLAPFGDGKRLATTTYAIVASVQLFVLFALWSPTGIVLFKAEGPWFFVMSGLFSLSWLLLMKSILDAGPLLQSGALGWLAELRNIAPKFPDMPETGLFKIVRQPIYVAFSLTLWTPPIWTVDQLIIAVTFTLYCIVAPLRKEKRFLKIYGTRFRAYQARVPYWVPFLPAKQDSHASENA
ncbi:MAG: isoprenylcysteine carboxylmethyltransferase family protein [Pseudomonadota bacterium]